MPNASGNGTRPTVRVSALVSTYNSERFLPGCIEDLMAQTLWQRGELEIVVINAGSAQDENVYLRDCLRRGIPLIIINTLREPLYASWNRGLRIASGDYITNANTDDRHAPHALETLADTLDAQPDIALVYADSIVTTTPNAIWGGDYALNTDPPYGEALQWPSYEARTLLHHCYMGPHPMWRKALHDTLGGFDESFQVAGDYEMWLRLAAAGHAMHKIDQRLGLFHWHPDQLGRQQQQQSQYESRRALLRYRHLIEERYGHPDQPE